MLSLVTLLGIGAQIAVSFYNQSENRKTAQYIKAQQRAAKEAELKNNNKRDMDKFIRSCELQERMEFESHQHRIKSIRQGFLDSFDKMIHNDNIDKHYRLNVSPYIIQRSVIPFSEEDLHNVRQELFCILTGSNDANFNSKVLPYIDESVSSMLSQYWNEKSHHTVCYYQNMWDTGAEPFSEEDIENLHVLLPTPTIAVTPLFSRKNKKLTLIVYVWGVSTGNDDSIRKVEIDPEIYFEQLPKTYSPEEITTIVSKLTVSALCSVGQICDIFYWTSSYQPPLLPILLADNTIEVPNSVKEKYKEIYSQLYSQLALGVFPDGISDSESLQLAKDIVEINHYNHPERSVYFLESLMTLSKSSTFVTSLIRDSVVELYKVKTGNDKKGLDQINASLFQIEDISVILKLIELAKECKDESLVKELVEIIIRKITYWNK